MNKQDDNSGKKRSASKKRDSTTDRRRRLRSSDDTLSEQTNYLLLMERIAVAANEATLVDEAMQVCLDEICGLIGWQIGHLYMRATDGTDELIPTRLWHLDRPRKFKAFKQKTEDTRFVTGIGLPGGIMASGEPAWITDITNDAGFQRAKEANEIGVKGAFGFPVLVGREVVAVLEFFSLEKIEPDEQLVGVMAHVGTQLGRVIERNRAEEELNDSKSRLTQFFQASFEAILFHDKGTVLDINPSAGEMFGYKPGELIGKNILDFISEDSRQRASEVMQSGSDVPYEINVIKKNGSIIPIEVRAKTMNYEGVAARVVALRDITERKRAEDALKESEELLRRYFDAGLIGMAINSADGSWLQCNDTFCDMLGYSREELFTKTFRDITHPQDIECEFNLFKKILDREIDTYSLEKRCIRKDGQFIHVNVSIEAFCKKDGTVDYVVAFIQDITERKQAEQALKESEYKLREAQRIAQLGFWDWDLLEDILYCSDELLLFSGLDPNEPGVTKDTLLKAVHPEDREGFQKNFLAALNDDIPFNQVNRIVLPDGQIRYHHSQGELIRDDSGKPVRMFGTVLDITESKQAEEALLKAHNELEQRVQERTAELSKSEEQFRTLVSNLPGAVYQYVLNEGQWQLVLISDEIETISGYPASEFMPGSGRNLISITHPDEKNRVLKEVANSIDTKRSYEIEYRICQPNGEERWVFEKGQPVYDADGRVVSLDGTLFDITERKRAEEDLRESQQLLQGVIENSAAGIYVKDYDGRYLLINKEFEKVTKTNRKDVIGKTDHEIYPKEIADKLRKADMEVMSSLQLIRAEEVVTMGDDAPIFLSLKFPLFDVDGNANGICGISTDISEQKRMLTELSEAKQEAEAASETKANFLATMSHEIRTPMNAIIGMTHLASKTNLTLQQRDYLSKIQSASTSLLAIIDDILDFSKIEAGKMDIESTEFEISRVLDNVTNLFSARSGDKNIEFLVFCASSVARGLIGDPLRLEQVLINLVNNAFKFTEEGEIVLSVDRISENEDETLLHFSVKDTGIGIESEKLDRLFKSFSQSDISTTRKYGGTGLGLAISQQLVNMMGGHIQVQSKPNEGSTFSFEITYRTCNPDWQETYSHISELRDLKILVVDDNSMARQILAEMVKTFGMDVLTVDSGKEAIEELERTNIDKEFKPYDIVLMDWKMPGIDGIETTLCIQSNDQLQKIPTIIMVTAYDRDEAILRSHDAKIDAFLNKPVNSALLRNTLLEALGFKQLVIDHIQQHEETVKEYSQLHNSFVLIAEDNAINQQVITELLEQYNIKVDIVQNGREAVEQVRQQSYDLVLMDVQMPEMDGYEATQQIRLMSEFADLPIIAMTAHALVSDREKSRQAGMNDHISKPIDPAQLYSTLSKWINVETKTTKLSANNDQYTLPADLPGIDINTGLQRVRNRHSIYQKILLSYLDNHSQDIDTLGQAISDADWEKARATVHALKGVSGTIGAMGLYGALRTLEEAISGGGNIQLAFDICSQLHTEVINGLKQLPETETSASSTSKDNMGPQGQLDVAVLDIALQSLSKKINTHSFDAEQYLPQVEQALAGTEDEKLKSLKTAIDGYQFDRAQTIVNELLILTQNQITIS